MRRNTIIALCALLLVLAAMAAKSLLVSVPHLRAQTVPGEFDAERAKSRLARILGDQRPHAVDTDADDLVRGRLIGELRALGLNPLVRDQPTCNEFEKARLVACSRIRNVIAVMGPQAGKALLLNAHYDSVPVGPGAGDDGVGVATLLEVAANLRNRQLKRPVILLFNEGEELGLVGARAFLADPLSRAVDSLLNFEARGVTGPVTMFQTSQPNGAAVAAFSAAVARPMASSLMTDVFERMPNDTDVTTFNERKWLTLNFAMTGNETHYHSPGDDLASLDPRSLQHMGDQALALSYDLSAGVPKPKQQQIFVDVLGRGLITMPLLTGVLVFAGLLLAFLYLSVRRAAYGRAFATVVLAFFGAIAGGWLATLLMGVLRAGTFWRAFPIFSLLAIYAAALLGIVVALQTLGRRVQTAQLRIAFWSWFLALGGALALAAPGAIIYFLGPPVALLLGVVASRWNRSAEAIGAVAALLLLYVTWGEMLALMEELFSPGPLWIVAPVGALMMMAALVEFHRWSSAASARAVVGGSAAVALAALAGSTAAPAYSADRQQLFTIEHVTEFPGAKSQWSVLSDGAALPKSLRALGSWKRAKPPFTERWRWLTPAQPIPGLKPVGIEVIENISQGTERTARLRLHMNGATRVALVAPEQAHVRSAGFKESRRPLGGGDSSGEYTIVCAGRSCDGAELTIVSSSKPAEWKIVGLRSGLPQAAEAIVAARPRNARPQYAPDQTVTVTHMKL